MKDLKEKKDLEKQWNKHQLAEMVIQTLNTINIEFNHTDNLKRENEKLRTQNNMLQRDLVALTQKFKGVIGFRTSDRCYPRS